MGTRSPVAELELTKRQREVIELLTDGYSNLEIAQALGISLDGAKWHVGEILARLNVGTREEAASLWLSRPSRRPSLAGRIWVIACAFPLKAFAAIAEVLRPGPAIRTTTAVDEANDGHTAIASEWRPPPSGLSSTPRPGDEDADRNLVWTTLPHEATLPSPSTVSKESDGRPASS